MGWKSNTGTAGFLVATAFAAVAALRSAVDFGHNVDGQGKLSNYHLNSEADEREFSQMRAVYDSLEAEGRFADKGSFAAHNYIDIPIPYHGEEVLHMGDLGPAWLPAGESGFFGHGHLMGVKVDMREATADDGTVVIELLLNANRDEQNNILGAERRLQIISNQNGYQIWDEFHPRRQYRHWNVDLRQSKADPTPN